MTDDFLELLEGLRPYIIKKLQDERVDEYIRLYKEINKSEPSKEDINTFISALIAHGYVKTEADQIIIDVKYKYNKKLFIQVALHSTYVLLSVSVYIAYILIYLSTRGYGFVDDKYIDNVPIFTAAAILLLVTLISNTIGIRSSNGKK